MTNINIVFFRPNTAAIADDFKHTYSIQLMISWKRFELSGRVFQDCEFSSLPLNYQIESLDIIRYKLIQCMSAFPMGGAQKDTTFSEGRLKLGFHSG